MKKRIIIVGGVSGGASTATRLRRLNEDAEIIIFERGEHVSFSNCSLPYYLSGYVENAEKLVMMNPDSFLKKYRINVQTRHEVMAINREKKTVKVKKLNTGDEIEEAYDELVLSMGANPVVPPFEGLDKIPHFTVRTVNDVIAIRNQIDQEDVSSVAVIGGGFIGLEVAENLVHAGKEVSLIEAAPQVLLPLDEEMAGIVHKVLMDEGINLYVADKVVGFDDGKVKLESKKDVKADAVILAIGVKPDIKLAQEAGLQIGKTGGILVDEHYMTSDPYIYAVGDAIEVFHDLAMEKTRLALAGPAHKQARTVANYIFGQSDATKGVIGSSAIKVFDYNVAFTGLNERKLIDKGIPYDFVFIIPSDIVSIMPGSHPLFFKLLFERPSGRILGAQAIGKGDAVKRIDIIASTIHQRGTVEDLRLLELCYSPIYGTAKDVVNVAGLVGLNVLNQHLKQISLSKLDELLDEEIVLIDVRETKEYEGGHFKKAINIPMSTVPDRLAEIPKDRPVYVHCRTGQRSYNVVRLLRNMGYNEVYNVAGSFLGYSMTHASKDKLYNREPKVTNYCFD